MADTKADLGSLGASGRSAPRRPPSALASPSRSHHRWRHGVAVLAFLMAAGVLIAMRGRHSGDGFLASMRSPSKSLWAAVSSSSASSSPSSSSASSSASSVSSASSSTGGARTLQLQLRHSYRLGRDARGVPYVQRHTFSHPTHVRREAAARAGTDFVAQHVPDLPVFEVKARPGAVYQWRHHAQQPPPPAAAAAAAPEAATAPRQTTVDPMDATVFLNDLTDPVPPQYGANGVPVAGHAQLLPDHTDPATVLALAQMTKNSYLNAAVDDGAQQNGGDTGWLDIPGWNLTDRFGWDSDGIRGYVFTDLEDDVMVIALKGTSLATPLVGGGVTSPRDKLMDNLMFSCCCGKAGWSWTPVCDCAQGAARDKQCNVTCLHDATNTGGSYYNLAQTIFLAVKADYPHRYAIWMAGHSLGGALASLTALTHDVPAFTFEAPGDLLYAQRLALLPRLPPPSPTDPHPNYDAFLARVPIYHFGNTRDPIFLGECVGATSSCWYAGYALESKCHAGKECLYDPAEAPGLTTTTTTTPAANAASETSPAAPVASMADGGPSNATAQARQPLKRSPSSRRVWTDVRWHTIDMVLSNILTRWDHVAPCAVRRGCTDCTDWQFITPATLAPALSSKAA